MRSYEHREGEHYYRFELVQDASGNWIPYIRSRPQAGPAEGNSTLMHVMYPGSPSERICWTDAIPTAEDAREICRRWSFGFSELARTGRAPNWPRIFSAGPIRQQVLRRSIECATHGVGAQLAEVVSTGPRGLCGVYRCPAGHTIRLRRDASCRVVAERNGELVLDGWAPAGRPLPRGTLHGERNSTSAKDGVTPQRVVVHPAVMRRLRDAFERAEPEIGALLGSDSPDGVITALEIDLTGSATPASFTPDNQRLSELLDDVWRPTGVRLVGIAHLHPAGCSEPSTGDLAYARTVLEAMPELPHFVMPIGCRDRGGRLRVRGFVVERRNGGGVELVRVGFVATGGDGIDSGDPFARVRAAVDVERLAKSLVVVVGVGGAASMVEDLARLGVGAFVLIDPDRISMANLSTQQAYRRDLGRPKVSALAERLRDISPSVAVRAIARRIEEISDDDFARILATANTSPDCRLLLGMTDYHPAQAHVNRLGLKFGVPSLCAQVYAEGRGGEITFVVPGETTACHRCILHDRYDAFEGGFVSDVTSNGVPLWATTRINATTEMLATAMLHRGTGHRLAKLLERIRGRQLLQFLLDDAIAPFEDGPDARATERWNGLDDTVFVRTTPLDSCPDCGGTGDLREIAGVVRDTRVDGGRHGRSAESSLDAARSSERATHVSCPGTTEGRREVSS